MLLKNCSVLASIQLRETKTIKLRKNMLQLKLEALKPKPPITRSRSPPYLLKEGEVQAVPVKADDATADKGKAIRKEKGKRVRRNEPGRAAQEGVHKGKTYHRGRSLGWKRACTLRMVVLCTLMKSKVIQSPRKSSSRKSK